MKSGKEMAVDKLPIVKASLKQIRLEAIALRLAWDDLDEDDKRVYMREAQKQMSKEKK
jgi:hypothetical protein